MREHIKEIVEVTLAFSEGDYTKKASFYEDDDLDALALGINMLGEELLEKTTSGDYFGTLFHEADNMIIILDKDGLVEHINNKAIETITNELEYTDESFDVFQLFQFSKQSTKEDRLKSFIFSKNKKGKLSIETRLKGKVEDIPVLVTCHYIEQIEQFVLMINDITLEKQQEQKLLRTIVETQLNEQNKIAKELHDSVTQNLSGAKMIISQLVKLEDKDKRNEALHLLSKIVDDSIVEIRDLSHNLMPSYLRHPINDSIAHLFEKMKGYAPFDINYYIEDGVPELSLSNKSAIYRIIQEFSHNTLKYAQASELFLRITYSSNKLELTIKDNGIGFDMSEKKLTGGVGISSMLSRLKIFNGEYEFISSQESGTSLYFCLYL